MIEICKKCAECCKNYPFVTLSQDEIHSLKELTGLPAQVFTNPIGKEVEEYFLQFQNNGHCYFLNENEGSFSCAVYEERPGICKEYPSNPAQENVCAANKKKLLIIESIDLLGFSSKVEA